MVTTLKNGKAHTNNQNLNKAISTLIPSPHSHFSRSIASFCRLLLNIKKMDEQHWKVAPSAEEIQHVQNFPLTISSHPIQSKSKLSPIKPDVLHGISLQCRDLFLIDLKATSFPTPTFSWYEPWESHWNQIFSSFILKHWNHGHKYGALSNFPFNSSHNTSINANAVLKRWFMGRSIEIKKNKYSPNSMAKKAYQVKKSKWRKQVSPLSFIFFQQVHHYS